MDNLVLANNELNALRIENTDRITIGFVTTGPISISWGDGTILNLTTQTSRYNASKLYSSIGNWNIVKTNPENVKEIYFDIYAGYKNVNKINTPVNYLLQFDNLTSMYIHDGTFSGNIGPVLAKLQKLEKIYLRFVVIGRNSYTINITDAKTFWPKCKYLFIQSSFLYISLSMVAR